MNTTTRSSNYRFTCLSLKDSRIGELRKSIKGTGSRVVIRARLGKKSPHAKKYGRNPYWNKSGLLNESCILLEHGSRFDVYVYCYN